MARKKTLAQVKQLVKRAKWASGNDKLGLDRMPKGHWMRKDQAKIVRSLRTDKFGKTLRGIQKNH